uniref:Uncharacterized protein n=1 Tax=Aquifex pyrophilus TaxID=2714 RepID=Q8GLK8_AQUPY|nr:hypothetical protein [Aquifex pyrophilus]
MVSVNIILVMRKGMLLLPILIIACAPVSEKEIKIMKKRISEFEGRVAKLEERQEETGEKLEIINERVDKIAQEVGEIKRRIYLKTEKGEELIEEETSKSLEEIEENPEEEYREALNPYKMKRLNEARDAFVNFIKKYPKTNLTDNAYFWLGTIYYELGNEERALQILKTLIGKCKEGRLPDCNKLPDTYYMLVKIYAEEGNESEAERYLNRLKEEFPDTPLIEKAEKVLYKNE